MLTRLRVRNFKRFDEIDVELGATVVFVGPNQSGKTTALQALALWDLGMREWVAHYGDKKAPPKRPGFAINRRDLLAVPVSSAELLWRDAHTRIGLRGNGKTKTKNIRIEITVDGSTNGTPWSCGFEFDYDSSDTFNIRPLRKPGFDDVPVEAAEFYDVPREATTARAAFLPPMSGLAAHEPKWEPGRIQVLLGEGETAQVLRNLCLYLYERQGDSRGWTELVRHIDHLFDVELNPPRHIARRGEVEMDYVERGVRLDLSCAGRGLQQTLLLLAYVYANPGTALLLDEPDAHLEILRQREAYQLLTDVAASQGCQVIAASHSEVVLEEAVGRDIVVAFVGEPHRIDARARHQVRKALATIRASDYLEAEEAKWVLYLEGSSDLAFLREFARALGHEAASRLLERPFVHYVELNTPAKAREHFFGIREAIPSFVGIAIFDRLPDERLQSGAPLVERAWKRREIENYVALRETLERFAAQDGARESAGELFERPEVERRVAAMTAAIADVESAREVLGQTPLWSDDTKASDDVLAPVFANYFKRLGLSNAMNKSDYHSLVACTPTALLAAEIREMLDAIVDVGSAARHGQH